LRPTDEERGRKTGYLWSGSNIYTGGKYVSDGVWSSSAEDEQLGIVPMAKRMVELDPSLDLGAAIGALVSTPIAAPVAKGFVPREKVLEARRDLACLKLAAPAEFLSDVGRDVARPAFGGVEADDADGLRILPVEQVLDDGLEVRGLDIGFAVGAPAPTEIVHYQADVLIVVSWHNRGRPICVTHNATPDA
jgi:hypothetical protein